MTPKEAKKILIEMKTSGVNCEVELTKKHIHSLDKYVSVDFKSIILDGDFTIEELEAITVWYRDPKGVSSA